MPPPTAADRDRALAEAQRQMLGVGLTSVADMGTSAAEWRSMLDAATAGRLKVRVMAYAAGLEPLEDDREADRVAVRRPAAVRRGQALRRRRAGVARRVAEARLMPTCRTRAGCGS